MELASNKPLSFYGQDQSSGYKRHITHNLQHIFNTYDGNFHIEDLWPYALVFGTIGYLIYKNNV